MGWLGELWNWRKIRRLESELVAAGDRRDWSKCSQLEEELRKLKGPGQQTFWLWCPGCKGDLTTKSLKCWEDSEGMVNYNCRCGLYSRWFFDFVPIQLEPRVSDQAGSEPAC